MPQVFNLQKKAFEDLPEAAIPQAVASGAYAYRKSDQLNVISPQGELGTISGADAQAAFAKGFQLEGAEATTHREGEAKYGSTLGQGLAAGALGAGRSLSFGGTDVLARSLGVAPETLKGLAEYNPAWTMGGELLGVGAGTLATGGILGAAGAGVRGASAIGGLAEAAGASALRGIGAEGAIARAALNAAPRALGAAVESVPYAMGQLISEKALGGNPELTAEHVLATVGLNALLGGAAGGAASFGPELLSGLRNKVLSDSAAEGGGILGKVGKATGKQLEDLWAAATGIKPAEGFGESAAAWLGNRGLDISSTFTGIERSHLQEVLRPGKEANAIREAMVSGPEVRDTAVRNLSKHVDDFRHSAEAVQDESIGTFKIEKAKQMVQGDANKMADQAFSAMDAAKAELASMSENSAVYGLDKMRQDAARLIGHYEKSIVNNAGAEDAAAKIFIDMDKLKRQLGSDIERAGRRQLKTEEHDALDVMKNIYEGFRTHLEDSNLYGKAGIWQKEQNVAWSEYLSTAKLFNREFMEEIGKEGWDKTYAVNRKSIKRLVDNITDPTTDHAYSLLTGTLDRQEKLIAKLSESYDLSPAVRDGIQAASKSKSAFSATLGDIENVVTRQNQMKAMEQAGQGASQLVGGGIGYAIGGFPGAVIGGLMNAAANPAQIVKNLVSLNRMGVDAHARIGGAIDAFMASRETKVAAAGAIRAAKTEGARERAKTARRLLVPGVVTIMGDTRRGKETSEEAYKDDMDTIAGLSPEVMQQRIAASLGDITQTAPDTAAALAMKATQAIGYLTKVAPRPPVTAQISPLLVKGWTPSKPQLASWERTKAAVTDPMAVVDGFAHGVITKEGAEAMRECYPEIYQQMQTEVAKKAGAQRAAVPYQKRVMLSLFFGVPLEPMMEPAMLASVQADFARQNAVQGQGQQGLSMGGMQGLRQSEMSMTKMDRIQQGA